MNLKEKILNAKRGIPHIYSLGQAGFVFQSSKGTLLGVDLYLSNCVERFDGFKRLLPYILEPEDIEFDYLICTHAHYDHFDIDSLPLMLKEKTKLLATDRCKIEAEKINLNISDIDFVKYLDRRDLTDIKVDFVFCDHGDSAPDAVGLVIDLDGYKIYITGDTRLRLDKVLELKSYGVFDLMIAPINGAFGNLDSTEAAILAHHIKPKLTIPCHFWNFIEHLSNPIEFDRKMKLYNTKNKHMFLRPGEELEMNFNNE